MILLIGVSLLCLSWPGWAQRTSPQPRRGRQCLLAVLLTAGLCSLAVIVTACNIHVGSGH